MSFTAAQTYEFTVEEYNQVAQVLFRKRERVELLDGKIVVMSPIGYRHIMAVRHVNKVFHKLYGDQCAIDSQSPVIVGPKSEPEPDVLLLDLRVNERESAPLASDILLLVEVADSSLGYDRSEKKPVYARNGVREYWIVDLTTDQLQVFREPSGADYLSEQILRSDESIAPLAFPDQPIRVAELLPRPL